MTIEKNKLGVGIFILSEANFFLMLILTYLYFNGTGAVTGPTAATGLQLTKAGVYTLLLLASSLTFWWAEKNLKQGRQAIFRIWLFVTAVLGAVFLFGQGREWAYLINENVTINRNLFGTTFFTLTGFHGFHVLIGLLAIAILLGLALAGDFKDRRTAAVAAVSLYWHFVDAVWIVIFFVVYLGVVL
jgi:heme/copper-type cytochrome/quinol oxidase subunit 3